MKILAATILVLICSAPSFSQSEIKKSKSGALILPKAEISVGLQVILPTATYGKNIKSIPVGLSGQYFRSIGSKFMLGVELNAACISHAEYAVELDNGESITLEETENMWGAMLAGRFNFIGNSAFRTYTEVRVGTNSFNTTISSCNKDAQGYAEKQSHGTSLVSSLGLGLSFDPKALFTGESGGTWIALRGAYVVGTNANYRQAPESSTLSSLNSHLYNSSIGYIDLGISASWQLH
jgi:hypothetical protein